MAKITRAIQKLFGSSAPANSLAQFGSFAAGTPARYSGATATPANVQALSNYLTGMTAAIIGNNAAELQDVNALFWLYAYQLCYIFQSGIPEWETGTTYYKGSLVTSSNVTYRSTTDNNTGNVVSDGVNWASGLLTDNSVGATTVVSGQCLFNPFAVIPTGATCTVNSGGQFVSVGTLTVNGSLVINGTSKVI